MIKELANNDSFDCWSYYGTNYSGCEDHEEFEDYSDMEEWVWDKLQHGLFVEVNGTRFNPGLVEWGCESYGIEDYLDEGISMKSNKKVNEDFGTNTNDIDSMLDAVLDFVYTYDYWDNDAIDQETGYFTEDAVEQTRDMLENRDPALADYLESYVNDFVEDGEKFDGKIADIIDYLRGRNSDEDKHNAMAMKNEDVNKVNTSDFDGDKTNESLDEAYKGIDLNDYRNIIYAALETLQDANISLGSMTDKDVATILRKLRHDEYAQRINKDVDDWSDEDFESEYDYELGKREKEIDDLYDEYGRYRNESLDEDNYKADDDFTDGEAETDENMNESLAGFKKLPVKSFERATNNSVPQTAELEDEVADESFAHDDSM